ncbi:MAG: hypothetical protein KGJ34_02630 [Patescibacteria group bacterium]|nr:hypothetical protein [Patescibacteria group bacterium]
MLGRRRKRTVNSEIAPDEIFADSSNIPAFDTDHFEGRVERPLARQALYGVGAIIIILLLAYAGQAWNLELRQGTAFAEAAQNNQLLESVVFADRGIITDRTGRVLASDIETPGSDFPTRQYAPWQGIAQVVGYAKPPAKDASGNYYRNTSVGIDGAEAGFNSELVGTNGAKITQTNALKQVVSQSTLVPPQNGSPITLSIDAAVSQGLYQAIANMAQSSHFVAGAGVIMDVRTGQIIAMVSYPEFSLQTMADGTDTPAIQALLSSPGLPFLNRAIDGLYTPGSIVKPIVAIGALTEGVINENTQILSTGSISIPNPYDPSHPSIFLDWRPQGWVNVRQAIAVSSDVFFYEVGGGYQSQPGIGISGIDKYFQMFGFGAPTGLQGFTESSGVVPSPAWKARVFPGDPWNIGDTYHTAIGQYGLTVTPLQMVRAVAAIANGGTLLTPTLLASSTPEGTRLPLNPEYLTVAQQGMRLDVTGNATTGHALDVGFVDVASKTGTAQIGTQNQFENSWVTGFYPYENPHYAFAVVLEKGPPGIPENASIAEFNFLTWLNQNYPQYLQ